MSHCDATQHGDHNAYRRGCRCPEAREDRRLYYKRWREGRLQPGMVPSAGSVRRLRALSALGWSPAQIAERMGATPENVQNMRRGRSAEVTRLLHDRVASVYEVLSGTPGPSESARRWAERSGWAPPLAWDDDAIDNPAASPVTGDVPRSRVDLGDVKHLERFGVPRDEVARRMNVTPEAIVRAEYRALERTRAAVERARDAIREATDPAAVEAAPSSRELEHAR